MAEKESGLADEQQALIEETDRLLGITKADSEMTLEDYRQCLQYLERVQIVQCRAMRNKLRMDIRALLGIDQPKETFPLREQAKRNQKTIDWLMAEKETLEKKIKALTNVQSNGTADPADKEKV